MKLSVVSLLFVVAVAFAQPADVPGWNAVTWGVKEPAALTVLRPLNPHPSGDTLAIDDYRQNGLVYHVRLIFDPKNGLSRVTMSAPDDRESVQKALAELTSRYGRPGLRSEYDGDRETTRTIWEWTKSHGKVSLASDSGDGSAALFIISYEARK